MYDAVCKRVLSFISKCVNSDCDLVSFSAKHAVYGCMSSPLDDLELHKFEFSVNFSGFRGFRTQQQLNA